MATTITVDENTHQRFRELKRELDDRQDGVPEHTSDSFLSALMDTWEAADEDYYTSNDELDEVSELLDKLERIEAMTQEATNAAQSADRKLDNMGGM